MNRLSIALFALFASPLALAVSAEAHLQPSGVPAVITGDTDLYQRLMQQDQLVQRYHMQLNRDINNLTQAELRLTELEHEAHRKQMGFDWVDHKRGAALPKNAVEVAKGQQPKSIICQAGYLNHRYPGHVTADGCEISYGGSAMVKTDYRILVAKKPVKWVASNNVPPPPPVYRYVGFPMKNSPVVKAPQGKNWYQPIIGGYEDNHYVYICRSNMLGGYHVGKVVTGHCDIAWQGKEASLPTYQVLTTGQKAKPEQSPTKIIPMGPGPVRLGPDGKPL